MKILIKKDFVLFADLYQKVNPKGNDYKREKIISYHIVCESEERTLTFLSNLGVVYSYQVQIQNRHSKPQICYKPLFV